jgi:predicted short-subunit dehydrogenase-like oxidoreductase (DUF2520 family)
MDVILAGPGRAGLALSLRLVASGHVVTGVLGRDLDTAERSASMLAADRLDWDMDLPAADLLVLAVRDDAIEPVAERLAGRVGAVSGAVHLSGLVPVAALDALQGPSLGSFHPLQTLPTPEAGAARLAGAWVAITASDDLFADRLFSFASSLDMRPFEIDDDAKALYHAAAASSANYVITALAMAERLFEAAGVPFEAAGPLVRAVIDNALEMGPAASLTGPIARGDVATVRAQVEAVAAALPDLAEHFVSFGRATAHIAGAESSMEEVLG